MGDFDKDKPSTSKVVETNEVGSGSRSLSNWQRLADTRKGGGDANAMLASYGIDAAALAGGGENASLAALERRLAFSGEVERDALGVHRGCELVVGPVAVAIAGVAAGVVAAAAVAAYAVNAAQTANVAWTTNWTSGAKPAPLPDPFNPQDNGWQSTGWTEGAGGGSES